jgi:hypothetical protein
VESPENKLNLYAGERSAVGNARYVFLLYSFWGTIPEPKGDPDEGRFDDYAAVGRQFFSLVSREKADGFLCPIAWEMPEGPEFARRMAAEAAEHRKQIIIFSCSDSDERVPIHNAIVFQSSLHGSLKRPNEFALPGWSVDCLKHSNSVLCLREKKTTPSVAYSGYVDYVGLT